MVSVKMVNEIFRAKVLTITAREEHAHFPPACHPLFSRPICEQEKQPYSQDLSHVPPSSLITKMTGTLAGMKFTFGTRTTKQRTFHDHVWERHCLKFTFPLFCTVHERFMHVLSWNIFF